MAPSQKDLKILFQRSGNRCAFPGCKKALVHPESDLDDPVVLSEIAHIVARSSDGPRGEYPLPLEERDKYDNLILLCEEHHHIVDSQPHTYTVERLRQMKSDHEKLILEATERAVKARGDSSSERRYVNETLHSTLLPVLRMPRYVYGVPCEYNDSQEREVAEKIVRPDDKAEMYPFIIRGGMLLCFQNLRYKGGPFRKLAGDKEIKRYVAREWWDDPDRMKWFVSLLNRSLNKLTGRKGLNLDKKHRRYYFMPEEPGKPLEVSYRPLSQSITTRQVVWQPITKKTGLPKRYWYHRAVALKFHRVSNQHWCLSIRPEMHVTEDGITPLDPDSIGSKVTRKKARMYNFDLLREVQFWRDFLSDSQPRIILPFGRGQHIIISTTMMQAEVEWPGMPEEYQESFKNVEYLDDLFSWAALQQLEAEYYEDDEEWEDWESWEDEGFEEDDA
jgi:hypothetical protein